MSSHQDNLAAVRAACVAANPTLKYHRCDWCHEPFGEIHLDDVCGSCRNGEAEECFKDPTLPDVLLALGKEYSIRGDGFITKDYGYETHEYITDEEGRTYSIQLDLRLPLSGQSEETVAYLAYLANLMKRDD